MRNKKSSLLLLVWTISLILNTGFRSVQTTNFQASVGGDGDDLRLLNSSAQAVNFHLAVPWEELS